MISVEQKQPPMTTPQIPCLAMRPAQAAKSLGISERTLRDWLAAGIVPCIRLNGVVLLPVGPLEKRLEELAELRSAPAREGEKNQETA